MPKPDPKHPRRLQRHGARLYYGDIHVATLHEDLTLVATPASLKRLAELDRTRVRKQHPGKKRSDADQRNTRE